MTKYQLEQIEQAEKENDFKEFPDLKVKFAGTKNASKWFYINSEQLKKIKVILTD